MRLAVPEVLQARAESQPGKWAFTFLPDDDGLPRHITYADLYRRARAVAAALADALKPGDRALLLFPAGLEFIEAFLGSMYAGVIAVPAYPPLAMRVNARFERLRTIAADAGAAAVITVSEWMDRCRAGFGDAALHWITADLCADAPSRTVTRAARARDIAFLQYTSGSTSEPKGATITHGNIVHNAGAIAEMFPDSDTSVSVSWLPVYHDMGLMASVIVPIYRGTPSVLMSPVSFLQWPARWLRAISDYRGTHSGGPNFAYDLCVERIPRAVREGLDLSSWRVAFSGAETVRWETLERFAREFGHNGFDARSFYPCYGLAEATVAVSGGKDRPDVVVCDFDGSALASGHAVPAASETRGARRLVSSGRIHTGHRVVIAQPGTLAECEPGEVGEICVSGDSVAIGYRNKPELTEAVFVRTLPGQPGQRFLRTGDLGFLLNGHLFITGRMKDLLKINGANHYPQDLERTVQRECPEARIGTATAFSIDLEGRESAVVIAETGNRALWDREPYRNGDLVRRMQAAAAAAIVDEHGIPCHAVLFVKPGIIPRTPNGKAQRYRCREAFLAGEFSSHAQELHAHAR